MSSAQHTLGLVLTLEDDCLFTESSATEGGLRTLPFIPGATLYGAVASHLYAAMQALGLQHRAFHQDRLRFLDGLPLSANGYPALPAPAVWQRKKTPDAAAKSKTDDLLNLAASSPEPGVQRKSMRNESIGANGDLTTTMTTTVLKTALVPGEERVRDGQLFAYESLRSGQRFYAEVHADADIDPQIWTAVSKLFSNTTLRLGRSRSAQFGRVRCTTINSAPSEWAWSQNNTALRADGSQRLVYWCVSDLALVDAFGQPTATPTANHFGLDPAIWSYSAATSAVDVRRYSPFHGYRRSYETERLVVRRGSVICFDAESGQPRIDAAALAELRSKLVAGVGLHRANGLGQLMLQPGWSQQEKVLFCPQADPHPLWLAEPTTLPEPTNEDRQFLAWLANRGAQSASADDAAAKVAQEIAQDLLGVITSAAPLAGGIEAVTPSRSQWGQLVEAGKAASSLPDLLHALAMGPLAGARHFEQAGASWTEDPSARKRNKVWFAASFTSDGKPTTLGEHLLKLLALKATSQVRPGAILAKLASAMRKAAERTHKDAA